MKKALCIKGLENITSLSTGETNTVEFELVDREICEKPENGYVQIIPYVSLSAVDIEKGEMLVMSYRRPAKGEGEDRLKGATSCGFGGHIDSEDDLTFSSKKVTEVGDVYDMSGEDLIDTIRKCAKRELKEELGIDIFDRYGIDISRINIQLEREQEPDEVGQVHLCVSMSIVVPVETLVEITKEMVVQKTEVEDVNILRFDVAALTSTFNVNLAVDHLTGQMEAEINMEAWSSLVIRSLILRMVDFMSANWNFSKMFMTCVEVAKEKAEKQAELDNQPTDVAEVETSEAVSQDSVSNVVDIDSHRG